MLSLRHVFGEDAAQLHVCILLQVTNNRDFRHRQKQSADGNRWFGFQRLLQCLQKQ